MKGRVDGHAGSLRSVNGAVGGRGRGRRDSKSDDGRDRSDSIGGDGGSGIDGSVAEGVLEAIRGNLETTTLPMRSYLFPTERSNTTSLAQHQ